MGGEIDEFRSFFLGQSVYQTDVRLKGRKIVKSAFIFHHISPPVTTIKRIKKVCKSIRPKIVNKNTKTNRK